MLEGTYVCQKANVKTETQEPVELVYVCMFLNYDETPTIFFSDLEMCGYSPLK